MRDPNTTLSEYLRRSTPMKKFHCEVLLTSHCNLNCKSCDHFAPFAEPRFYDIHQYREDIEHIHSLWDDKVEAITLQGGEPLLHPNVIDFFYITRDVFPQTNIQMITNGLLLVGAKDFLWEAMKACDVELIVSMYPSVKLDLIGEKARKYKIRYTVFGPRDPGMRKDILDLTGSQDPRSSFSNCIMANTCLPLSNGYVYTCPTAATILNYARKFNLNITEEDCGGKRVLDFKTREEMAEFYTKEIPLCRFCEKTIWNLPWEKSQGKVTDYLE